MPPSEQPRTVPDLSRLLDALRASRLQGFTLRDIRPASPRSCPRYADHGIRPLLLPLPGKQAVLWRLAESHYARWHNASLPIFEDGYFTYRVLRELAEAGRAVDLPQIYAVLARRFGPTSSHKDDWKEGFKIPLLLGLDHLGQTILYSLTVAQCKDGLEVRFRRQHSGVEHLDRDVYQQPFDAELTREQLNQCAGFILEYCSLAYHAAPQSLVWDFHFVVPAAQIAFGCLKGQFYRWHAHDEHDFEQHGHNPAHCARRAQDRAQTPQAANAKRR